MNPKSTNTPATNPTPFHSNFNEIASLQHGIIIPAKSENSEPAENRNMKTSNPEPTNTSNHKNNRKPISVAVMSIGRHAICLSVEHGFVEDNPFTQQNSSRTFFTNSHNTTSQGSALQDDKSRNELSHCRLASRSSHNGVAFYLTNDRKTAYFILEENNETVQNAPRFQDISEIYERIQKYPETETP